jgi:hypothetical protein
MKRVTRKNDDDEEDMKTKEYENEIEEVNV